MQANLGMVVCNMCNSAADVQRDNGYAYCYCCMPSSPTYCALLQASEFVYTLGTLKYLLTLDCLCNSTQEFLLPSKQIKG